MCLTSKSSLLNRLHPWFRRLQQASREPSCDALSPLLWRSTCAPWLPWLGGSGCQKQQRHTSQAGSLYEPHRPQPSLLPAQLCLQTGLINPRPNDPFPNTVRDTALTFTQSSPTFPVRRRHRQRRRAPDLSVFSSAAEYMTSQMVDAQLTQLASQETRSRMVRGMNLPIPPKNYTPGWFLSNVIWRGMGQDMEGL